MVSDNLVDLRVLHVIESFGAGSMQIAITIARGLADAGYTVAIAHGRVAESPRDPAVLVGPGVELFPIRWSRNPPGQLVAARELRGIVRAFGPDVIHLHSSFAGIVGAVALGGPVPVVYTPHGYSFIRDRGGMRQAAARLVERGIARRVDMIGAVSDYEAGLARGVGARRVEVVPNGIPELDDPIAAPAPPADPPLVVAVGRIDPARGPEGAAKILGALRDVADTEWVGAGNPSSDGATALAGAGVTVTGWLERSEVIARLASATACLHWSAWDSQPLAVLEAMSQDAVVVASDIPANRELLGARQVSATEHGAVQLLRRVVSEPDYREALLRDQRARRVRYSARRMVSGWIELYARMQQASR
jgi:glycosyltransferase involved in cell wall biosynthesis